jgi:hypothetical protein
MNIVELKEILQRNHVPDRLYNLPGMLGNDDCHSLHLENGAWTLSYCERGMPYPQKTFATEEEACQHLWEQIKSEVNWPLSLDAPPLSPAMAAFIEYMDRQSEIFTNRKLALWYKGFQVRGGEKLALPQVPYLFLYRNWPLKLDFNLSFADSPNQGNGLSATLSNFAGSKIQLKELMSTRGFTADAALFEYPNPTLRCEDHLARFAAALARALFSRI